MIFMNKGRMMFMNKVKSIKTITAIAISFLILLSAIYAFTSGKLANTITFSDIYYEDGITADVSISGSISPNAQLTGIMYLNDGTVMEMVALPAQAETKLVFSTIGDYIDVYLLNKNNLKPLSKKHQLTVPYFGCLKENIDIVAKMQSIVDGLAKIKFTGAEIAMTTKIKQAMNLTIEDAITVVIDEGYVQRVYADKVAEVKAIYKSIGEDAQSVYRGKVARLKYSQYLYDYFF